MNPVDSGGQTRLRWGFFGVVLALVVLGYPYYKEALFTFILSALLAYAIHPGVRLLESGKGRLLRIKMHRGLAILAMYLIVFVFCAAVLSYGVPPLVKQSRALVEQSPSYLGKLDEMIKALEGKYQAIPFPENVDKALQQQLESAMDTIGQAFQRTIASTFSLVTHLIELFMIPIIAFYLLMDMEKLHSGFFRFFPENWRDPLGHLLQHWGRSLDNYVRAQLLLCALMFVVATAFFALLRFDFAVVLGIIAGVTKAIPIIGPFLGAAPAVLIAFLTPEPLRNIVLITVFFTAAYLIENKVILPKLMEKYVDLHAVTVLLSILVGGKVAGLWGMFLAVPVASMIKILYLYLLQTYLTPAPKPEEG